MDRFGYTKMQITGLRDMDLLYPNTTYVHASHFTDEEWALAARLGRQRLVRAPDRGPDGPRLGARGHRARAQPPDRPVLGRRHHGAVRPVHPDALDLRLRARPQAPGGVGRRPRRARGVARADHLAPGPRVGDAGRGQGRGDRGPDRLDHARQEGRHRDHRRVRGERRADHRPRRGRGLRGRRLERQDRPRRRRDPQAGLQAGGVARPRRARPSRRRATTSSRSSATRSRAGCPRRPRPPEASSSQRIGARAGLAARASCCSVRRASP